MKQLFATALLALAFLAMPPAVAQSQPSAPTAGEPASGTRIDTFGPTLSWNLPQGTAVTQFHLQVSPAKNDGPGIDLVLASANSWFTIPAPPTWYGLLPDMTYTWRVRVSDAPGEVSLTDANWSEWSAASSFKTPLLSSTTIAPASPVRDGAVGSLTPTLVWADSNPNAWYYEVQVSRDAAFGPNAFLYWELRHGAVTNPPRSYTVPAAFPLEPGQRYYWRVRPRVQGDGAPADWTAPAAFTTPTSAETPAVVANVISGDTIEVLIAGARRTVKYLGIAAPAVAPAECYGAQAAARNSELVEGRTVRLVRDVSEADDQGRLLRYVFLGDTFVNAELVRAGYARTRYVEPDTRFGRDLANYQTTAQAAKAGLWGACPQ
jgi:micrococcal nuclease